MVFSRSVKEFMVLSYCLCLFFIGLIDSVLFLLPPRCAMMGFMVYVSYQLIFCLFYGVNSDARMER